MVKRVNKSADGMYHIKGKTYKALKGSRAAVWHETAFKTSGGLEKKDLFQNSRGRIVSKTKHNKMKNEKGSRFRKAGYELAKRGSRWGPKKSSDGSSTQKKKKKRN